MRRWVIRTGRKHLLQACTPAFALSFLVLTAGPVPQRGPVQLLGLPDSSPQLLGSSTQRRTT